MIKIHLFDMDHTLIGCDCDVTWKEYCIRHGLAPESDRKLADYFYEQYLAGTLDDREFTAFQLREFAGKSREDIAKLTSEHFTEFVLPVCRSKAKKYIDELNAGKAVIYLVSATNACIAAPVAEWFGIDKLRCTELEFVDGKATGGIAGTYAVQEGKVKIARAIAAEHGVEMNDLAYYGDSLNDIPVLSAVGHPFAVSPSEQLKKTALENSWPVLDW